MKAIAIPQFIVWLPVCFGAFAAQPTNTPVRVTISQFSRPPQDRIIVTATNMVGLLVKLFPGYEQQPADKFSRGHWPVDYTVEIGFADGRRRAIYVANNRWTAGADQYTPLTRNWDQLLGSMTTNFFKLTFSNMERLAQVHEPATLIIGPYETVIGRDMKDGEEAASVTQPSRSETNRTSSAPTDCWRKGTAVYRDRNHDGSIDWEVSGEDWRHDGLDTYKVDTNFDAYYDLKYTAGGIRGAVYSTTNVHERVPSLDKTFVPITKPDWIP